MFYERQTMNWRAILNDNTTIMKDTYSAVYKELAGLHDGKSWVIEYQDSSGIWLALERFEVSVDTGEIAITKTDHLAHV